VLNIHAAAGLILPVLIIPELVPRLVHMLILEEPIVHGGEDET
jgi:hypothetical protein